MSPSNSYRWALLSLGLVRVLSGPAAADVLIGLAYPMSGAYAVRGNEAKKAVEAAVADINAKGGINGDKIAVEVADDGCEEVSARHAARTLIASGVRLVVGHPCEKAALAVTEVYGTAATLFIAADARHPAFTDRRAFPTVLRLSGRDDRQGEAAVAWLAGQGARIAIVHDRTAYARNLTGSVVAGLKSRGITAPLVIPIVAGEKDYGAAAQRVATLRADAVFFAGYPSEMNVVQAALRSAGSAAPILGSDALATTEFSQMPAARDARLHVLIRHQAGAPPGTTNEAAAVALWAEAARQSGTTSPIEIAALLKRTAIRTDAFGWVSFDERGDARMPAFVPAQWSGSQWAADGPG